MTTRVMVVNFGPDAVMVSNPADGSNKKQTILFTGSHTELYVHSSAHILVEEETPEQKKARLEQLYGHE